MQKDVSKMMMKQADMMHAKKKMPKHKMNGKTMADSAMKKSKKY